MHTTPQTPAAHIGDVIEDSYGNPAVVVELDYNGRARTVVQTVGSDRGRLVSAGLAAHRQVTDKRADWARNVVRDLWPTLPANVRKTAVVQSAR